MQSPSIEYSSRNDCPGTFFRCEPQRAVLTTSSCARMWEQANQPGRKQDTLDRLHHCAGCELGALHADKPVIRSSALYGARICSRCHRPSARLIHGEHCPSCYNREREVVIGRNGQGTRPVKHPPLEPRSVLVACEGCVEVKSFKRTVDAVEVMVSVLRHVQGAVMFGFRSQIIAAKPRPVQLELF